MAPPAAERVEGPANAQATLRLFGQLNRRCASRCFAINAWCLLPEGLALVGISQDSYRIRKVTMRCYGPKEPWFTALVPRECSRHLNWMGVS